MRCVERIITQHAFQAHRHRGSYHTPLTTHAIHARVARERRHSSSVVVSCERNTLVRTGFGIPRQLCKRKFSTSALPRRRHSTGLLTSGIPPSVRPSCHAERAYRHIQINKILLCVKRGFDLTFYFVATIPALANLLYECLIARRAMTSWKVTQRSFLSSIVERYLAFNAQIVTANFSIHSASDHP